MGVSTDGILFYGYCWEDDGENPFDFDDEWTEVVLKKRGETNPWDAYPGFDNLPYEQRQKKGNEWSTLHRTEIDLCDVAPPTEEYDNPYFPTHVSIERLLAEYFDIDLNAEKDAVLEEIRAKWKGD